MEPDNKPAPDYSWIQNAQAPMQPAPEKKRIWLVVVIALVLLSAAALAAVLLLPEEKKNPVSLVVNGQMSAADAAPAIAAAQSFMDNLAASDINKAADQVSPTSGLEGRLTAAAVESYFGKDLKWDGCSKITKSSYEAETIDFAGNKYDSVNIEYSCRYTDGWPVVVILDMKRDISLGGGWLFGDAQVHDEASAGDTI